LVYEKFKIPSLIVTLGMSSMARGLALIICNADPVPAYVDSFRFIAKNSVFKIPMIWIVAAFVLVIGHMLGRYTRYGRYTYAIGGREEVSNLFRIPVRKTKILMFSFAGALYGLGGVLLTGRIGQASATFGIGWELDTIAGVVLGGTAVSGGVGGPARTFIGVFIMVALANGLNLMGVSPYLQTAIKGFVLIGAVAMTLDRAKLQIIK
jgi:ribose/xylose/arabinose/galactoside ABC-type transport system permease subunit